MKKRKPPIVLGTLLALFVAAAFGINYVNSQPPGGPNEQTPPPPMDPVGQPRAPESPSNIANDVKQAMSTAPGKPEGEASPKPPMRPGGPMGQGPLVMNPMRSSAHPQKPKPNPSSTSAQWWVQDAAK